MGGGGGAWHNICNLKFRIHVIRNFSLSTLLCLIFALPSLLILVSGGEKIVSLFPNLFSITVDNGIISTEITGAIHCFLNWT